MGGTFNKIVEPEISPAHDEYPTFPHDAGFPYERKKYEREFTDAELNLAGVPTRFRNVCVKEFIEAAKCRREMKLVPWYIYHCEHQNHAHTECQVNAMVDRRMEYERERRLRMRELRIASKAAAEEVA